MIIRHFRPSDAASLARLFYDSVHQIAAQYYSAQQIRAWVPAVPDPVRFEAWGNDGRIFLVAEDDGEALAFANLEKDGHIDHFFCRADRAGTGVSAALYGELEAEAYALDLTQLYVEASEPARRFFLRRGFTVDHRRDFMIGDVAIHNFRMNKQL